MSHGKKARCDGPSSSFKGVNCSFVEWGTTELDRHLNMDTGPLLKRVYINQLSMSGVVHNLYL